MIREEGKVIDSKDGLVKIQIDSKPACHSCKLCSRGKEGMTMEVKSDSVFSQGDLVSVEIEGRSLLLCFFMLYLFPVINFIIGVIVGMIVGGEVFEIIFGFIFFLISYFFVIRFDKRYKEKSIIKVSHRG
ncbi:MAG: SoxR reducing system RseC family protein [bacterium]